ncbi:MAG TPA: hypothetical protein VGG76_02215 [Gemmatimonadaceae bacterium]
MLYLKYARSSLVALALASGGGEAQTREGVSFDQTITSVSSAAGRYDSTTNILHMVAAGNASRIEMENNSIYPAMGTFTPGPHTIVLMHGGGAEIVFLNPDKKEYLSIKPVEMMSGFRKMIEGMGGSMVFDTANSHIGFDSLGAGQIMDGHQTVHYRIDAAMKMTISMMGQVVTSESQSTTDVFSAPDLAQYRDVVDAMSGFGQLRESMGMGGDFFRKVRENQRKAVGFPLRMVMHTVQTQQGKTRTVTQTIDSRNVRPISLADSVFAIPAGYKPISLPVVPGAAGVN